MFLLDTNRLNSGGREKSAAKNRLGSGTRGSKPRSTLANDDEETFTVSGQKNIGKWRAEILLALFTELYIISEVRRPVIFHKQKVKSKMAKVLRPVPDL